MLRPYIIGTYEGLKSRKITGTCCVYVNNTAEAAMKIKALFNNGISAIYITEEFYYDIRSISDKYSLTRNHVKLLPSSNSGDIGTIKDIKSQIIGAQHSSRREIESLVI